MQRSCQGGAQSGKCAQAVDFARFMEICAEVRWGIPLLTIATVSTQCQHSGGTAKCFRLRAGIWCWGAGGQCRGSTRCSRSRIAPQTCHSIRQHKVSRGQTKSPAATLSTWVQVMGGSKSPKLRSFCSVRVPQHKARRAIARLRVVSVPHCPVRPQPTIETTSNWLGPTRC